MLHPPRATIIAVLLGTMCTGAQAQWWLDVPQGNIPRTPTGEPNLTAPAPRTADGRPDLSGVWEPIKTYSTNLTSDLTVPGEVPFQPWAKALADQRATGSQSRNDPPAQCLPQGVPRLAGAPAPWKIVQTPGLTAILFENFTDFRQIFTDGRGYPPETAGTWFGYSLGRWEGDDFVVESLGFNGKTWLDDGGHPSSEEMKTTERFRRKDFGHLEIEFTFNDPKSYTKPWSVTVPFALLADTEIIENVCENEKDIPRLKGIRP